MLLSFDVVPILVVLQEIAIERPILRTSLVIFVSCWSPLLATHCSRTAPLQGKRESKWGGYSLAGLSLWAWQKRGWSKGGSLVTVARIQWMIGKQSHAE